MNRFLNVPAILLTLGLVVWFQEIFTVEWSSPYCSNPVDGPLSAVYGMPLPYIRWSGVSSMEYFWMPSIFVLNIAILFAIVYPIISRLVSEARTSVRAPESSKAPSLIIGLLPRWLAGGVGTFLILTFAAWLGLQFYVGIYKVPVSNIASENYEAYAGFRPVGFGYKHLRYQCTPLK